MKKINWTNSQATVELGDFRIEVSETRWIVYLRTKNGSSPWQVITESSSENFETSKQSALSFIQNWLCSHAQIFNIKIETVEKFS